jgi:hypothetical protein
MLVSGLKNISEKCMEKKTILKIVFKKSSQKPFYGPNFSGALFLKHSLSSEISKILDF